MFKLYKGLFFKVSERKWVMSPQGTTRDGVQQVCSHGPSVGLATISWCCDTNDGMCAVVGYRVWGLVERIFIFFVWYQCAARDEKSKYPKSTLRASIVIIHTTHVLKGQKMLMSTSGSILSIRWLCKLRYEIVDNPWLSFLKWFCLLVYFQCTNATTCWKHWKTEIF